MTDQQFDGIVFMLGIIAVVLCIIMAKVQTITKVVTKGRPDDLKQEEK